MPLPVGTYQINANTAVGQLIVSSSGTGFTGTAFGRPFVGFFDETSQTFSFLLTYAPGDPPTLESYKGTLFSAVSTAPDANGNTIQTTTNTLTGLFENFPNSISGPSTTGLFTWLATMSSSVKIKEHKEKEASKDQKDLKDHKEQHPDKVPHPEVLPPQVNSLPAGDVNATISQLIQRPSAVEQQLAIGQSFIAQEERPEVGLHAIEEPRPGFPQ